MCWDYVYEEEYPDTKGCCSAGVISNGKCFLFFTVCLDGSTAKETRRVFSSLSFSPETLECQYEQTEENDAVLFACLNAVDDDNYCGESSPVRTLRFR